MNKLVILVLCAIVAFASAVPAGVGSLVAGSATGAIAGLGGMVLGK